MKEKLLYGSFFCLVNLLALNGCKKSNSSQIITPPACTIPLLVTDTPINISSSSASSGGNITNDGDLAISSRGVCWDTTANPTISNSIGSTSNGVGQGLFASGINNLIPNTAYHVRAYAISSCGTGYGNDIPFTTQGNRNGADTPVTDIEGNIYQTVKICDQVWMAENLKVTSYNDGTPIANVSDPTQWTPLITGAWCYYNNDSADYSIYGKLYNGYTIAHGNLAPKGWHIASIEDWQDLAACLGSEYTAGGQMKSTNLWTPSSSAGTNTSGFTALPGGYRDATIGSFGAVRTNGYWWSNNFSIVPSVINYVYLDYSNVLWIDEIGISSNTGYSVRCVKDN